MTSLKQRMLVMLGTFAVLIGCVTVIIFAIAESTVREKIQPIVGGLLLIAIGIWLLRRSRKGAKEIFEMWLNDILGGWWV